MGPCGPLHAEWLVHVPRDSIPAGSFFTCLESNFIMLVETQCMIAVSGHEGPVCS